MSQKRQADDLIDRDDMHDASSAAASKRTDRLPDLHEKLKESEGSYMCKLLVPTSCCAKILGKQGKNMTDLIQSTGCRIRLSGQTSWYPTTTDRVLSIAGSPENMAAAILELLTTILQELTDRPERPESIPPPSSSSSSSVHKLSHRYCIRALVPAMAAGTIIGRGGSVIQRLAEETGCKLKFESAQESCYQQTHERIMIIMGDEIGGIVTAMQLCVAQMLTSSSVCAYENKTVNYAPLAPLFAGGMGQGQQRVKRGEREWGGGDRDPNPNRDQSLRPEKQRVDEGQADRLHDGYDPRLDAMHDPRERAPMGPYPYPPHGHHYRGMRGEGGIGYDRMHDPRYEGPMPMHHPSLYHHPHPYPFPYDLPIMEPEHSESPHTQHPRTHSHIMEQAMILGVEDDKIGSVMGDGGKIIKEIMAVSGAQITVSQKGDYLPGGTKNRRITIVGPYPRIQMAYSLIAGKLSGNHHPLISQSPPTHYHAGKPDPGGGFKGTKRGHSSS